MKQRIAVLVLTVVSTLIPLAASARTPILATNAFPVAMPKHVADAIREASVKHNVDPNLLAAMAYRESRFDSRAVSRRGAAGVMQLMPRTAKWLGVKNSFDSRENIFGGAKYLRMMLDRFDGNVDLALAGYNAGPELVAKKGPRATQEAVEYVAAVKKFYSAALRML